MEKGIDWKICSKEERDYYDYYLSLGYDERTATVLALFSYGRKRYMNLRMEDLYKRVVRQKNTEETGIWARSAPTGWSGSSGPSSAGYSASIDSEDAEESLADGIAFPESSEECAAMPTSAHVSERRLKSSRPEAARKSSAGSARPPRLQRAASRSRKLNAYLENSIGSLAESMETDEYDPIEEKEFRGVANNRTSTFRMTTNTASAGVIFNQLRNDRRIDMSMVRIEEMLNYFRYKSEKPESEMFRISHELRSSTGGKKLLYINVQGREEVKSRQNIVVLLDVSGSMTGNEKYTQAVIATIISKLNPGDKFSLITYSSSDEVVLRGMEIRGEEDKTHALENLLGIEIFGGTWGSAGIETAYQIGKEEYIEGGNNQVIMITDGDLNFGITDRGGLTELIEEKKKSNLFLSVIGTGLYNYKDDKLETLCKHGNGVYRVINNLADVKKCIDAEYASLVNIIAKDVKAQVEFNPEVVKEFRLLGFENREISHEDFTNDKVISEPFGSGGYGVALYELVLKDNDKPVESEYKYSRIVTTGSEELGTVKVRYKEPLEDKSAEIEYVIPSAEETYSDNLRLAYVVYVCAEKLRGSDKINKDDIKQALALYDELGDEIRKMNEADIYKLPEILKRSEGELNVGINARKRFEW